MVPVAVRFLFLLNTAQRAVQRRSAGELAGITGAQAGVLFLLGSSIGATIGEVARGLEATPSSMTELIDRMVAAGLIERRPDPDDGRVQRLTLTAEGEAARRLAVARVSMLNALMMDGFDEAEIAVVARWLDAVRVRFSGLPKSTLGPASRESSPLGSRSNQAADDLANAPVQLEGDSR